jgi:hypothetical protein
MKCRASFSISAARTKPLLTVTTTASFRIVWLYRALA